jgi:hypothetical protein
MIPRKDRSIETRRVRCQCSLCSGVARELVCRPSPPFCTPLNPAANAPRRPRRPSTTRTRTRPRKGVPHREDRAAWAWERVCRCVAMCWGSQVVCENCNGTYHYATPCALLRLTLLVEYLQTLGPPPSAAERSKAVKKYAHTQRTQRQCNISPCGFLPAAAAGAATGPSVADA